MKFKISSPARIHISLVDLNGSLGRIDGGLGFSINKPNFVIEFSDESSKKDAFLSYIGPDGYHSIIKNIIQKFETKFELSFSNLEISVIEKIPEHIGLGSKTQFLLTICTGLCILQDKYLSIEEMAQFVNRGGTSGIGYQIFEEGGFVIDLGHSFGLGKEKTSFLPSSASRASPALPFFKLKIPEEWDIILIQFNIKQGANKEEEINIFQKYCPISEIHVAQISHRILMQFLPGLLEHNLKIMADALNFINNHGFKQIEISLQHKFIDKIIKLVYNQFHLPTGMSSFGPTIFIVVDKARTHIVKDFLINILNDDLDSPSAKIIITKPNNFGHMIEIL